MNLTEIGVGITTLRPLRNGSIRIEAGSEKEIEKLGEKIGEECGVELEVKIQRLRNPRLVMLGIPEETTIENARETLMTQNPELSLDDALLDTKYCYTTNRGNRNLVIEVDSRTRTKLLHARVKMGWTVCKLDDYIVAKRCFRCSRYNHTHRECKGEETCPLCAGKHKLKECTTPTLEHKCVNCMAYNKHHPTNLIDTAHSSLDRNCPSLKAVLDKYKRNTDY